MHRSTRRLGRGLALVSTALAGILILAGCASSNPIGGGTPTGGGQKLVIGSQAYYSNEIIAELYAQALEAKGFQVNRQYQIGQREVYMPEIQAGKIDVFPEYSGNLLQYLDKQTTAKTGEQVLAALPGALPGGLRVLNAAGATDQDSYNVTKAFADQYGLATLADLKKVPGPIKVGANSEFATRPYGPQGLKSVYGVDVTVVPVEDSGGPLTVKALKDGTVQAADIYSADPSIAANGFVTLADPQALILPQNVVPVVSAKVDDAAAEIINKVSAALDTLTLIELNQRSVKDQAASKTIAADWLKSQGLI